MKSPIEKAVRLSKNHTGATAIEYGLIAALISVAIITGATTFGERLDEIFSEVRAERASK